MYNYVYTYSIILDTIYIHIKKQYTWVLFIYLFYLNHTQWYSREHKKYNGLEGTQ